MLYKVKLNATHSARPEQVTNGYLGFTGQNPFEYSRGQAIKKARLFGGKIEKVESDFISERYKVGLTVEDTNTGKFYTALEVDGINMKIHYQVSGRTEAESKSIAKWTGITLVKHLPNR